MKTDLEIRLLIEIHLLLRPDLDATQVDISVYRGVVTLSGFATSEAQRYQIVRLACYVVGDACVANDICVRAPAVQDETRAAPADAVLERAA